MPGRCRARAPLRAGKFSRREVPDEALEARERPAVGRRPVAQLDVEGRDRAHRALARRKLARDAVRVIEGALGARPREAPALELPAEAQPCLLHGILAA